MSFRIMGIVIAAWLFHGSSAWGQEFDSHGLVVDIATDQVSDKVDAFGDPLPIGAVARFGTRRLRHEHATGLVMNAKGDMVATIAPNEIRLWKTPSGQELAWRLTSPSSVVRLVQVQFIRDGEVLETILTNGKLQRWEIASGNLIDQARIGLQRESPDNFRTECEGGGLKAKLDRQVVTLWDQKSGKQIGTDRGHDAPIRRLAMSPDGQHLASLSEDGRITLWDIKTRAPRWSVSHRAVRCMAVSSDKKHVAVGEGDSTDERSVGVLRILDAANGKELRRFEVHGNAVFSVAFSPDGRRLASAGADNRAILWDTALWAEIRHYSPRRPRDPKSTTNPWVVAFSNDGKVLAACSADDEETNLWKHENQADPIRIPRHWFVSFLSDGATLVTQNHFGHISLRDLATGREMNTPKTPGWLVRPDGRLMLVSSGDSREIRLWDRVLDEELYSVRGHEAKAAVGAFSTDGMLLATADTTGVIVLWSIASPPEVRLESLWAKLKRESPKDAARAIDGFVELKNEGVRYLDDRLSPVGSRTTSIPQLIANLDHRQFAVRHKATIELERLGKLIEPELKAALANAASLEAKTRMQRLLDRAADVAPQSTPQERAEMRSIAILERAGTEDAKRILTRLATGHLASPMTLEAQRALRRMTEK